MGPSRIRKHQLFFWWTFHTIADCPPLKDEVDVILLPGPESWQLPVLSFQKFPSFRGDACGAQPVPLKQTYLRRDGSASDAIERCTSIDTLCFRGPMYSHIDPTVAWAKMATVGSICEDIGTVKHRVSIDVPTQGWQCLWRHRTLYVDRYSVLQGSNVLAYRSHRSLSQNGYGGIYMRGHWNREAQSIYRRTYAGMAVPLTPSNAVRR